MTPYSRILRAAHSIPWGIELSKLEAVMAFLELKASGGSADADVLAGIRADNLAAEARAGAMQASSPGMIAVLPLFGIISHRASMVGDVSGPRGTSIDKFTAQFRQAAADPNIARIVIVCDSPGGTVNGVQELADEIFRARSKKPITAVADGQMASAAYWLCASATEVVCSTSATVGAIGIFSAYEDVSAALEQQGIKVTLIRAGKYKAEASGVEPLTDDAQAAMQSMVDDYYTMFVNSVARGRGVKASDVVNGFAQGRMAGAKQSVTLGLCDRIATVDQVLGKFGASRGNATAMSSGTPTATTSRAAAITAGPRADDDMCECPCEPCLDGDCAACGHEGCDCAGCACESAMESAKASAAAQELRANHARMREEIRIASLP